MNKSQDKIDSKKQAVDELVKHYRSTRNPIIKEEVFDLYKSILNKTEAIGDPLKPKRLK